MTNHYSSHDRAQGIAQTATTISGILSKVVDGPFRLTGITTLPRGAKDGEMVVTIKTAKVTKRLMFATTPPVPAGAVRQDGWASLMNPTWWKTSQTNAKEYGGCPWVRITAMTNRHLAETLRFLREPSWAVQTAAGHGLKLDREAAVCWVMGTPLYRAMEAELADR